MLLSLLLVLLVGCGYDRHEECEVQLESVSSSLHLSQLPLFATKGEPLPEGSIVKGVVVANDSSGNFYRTIVLEGEDMGVEVRLALYDLHALFPVGCTIAVQCGGLRVARTDGVLAIGRDVYDWSGGELEPVAPRSEVLSRVTVTARGEEPKALHRNLGELDDALCGRLIEVAGVHYEGEAATWGSMEYAGYADRTLLDSEGRSIYVRTSHYADFASVPIPEGEMIIRGILYKEKKGYVIKPRDEEDVAL